MEACSQQGGGSGGRLRSRWNLRCAVALSALLVAASPAPAAALQEVLGGGANQPVRIETGEPVPESPYVEPCDGPSRPEDPASDPYVGEISRSAEKLMQGSLPMGAIQTALLLGVLSLAPAILLMTTSYVRIVVVLGLLRQAFGAQQLPPTQVLAALSMFVTILVMTPVWQEIRREAVDPCLQSGGNVDWDQTFQRGVAPLKRFMVAQIVATGNLDSLNVFQQYGAGPDSPQGARGTGPGGREVPLVTAETARDVPLNVVLPAFLVSELKTAFLLGFQIFLPFLVLDLVVSTLGVSMGMVMLPPSMISLPLKLILFVMADGWNLVLGMLLNSFQSSPLY